MRYIHFVFTALIIYSGISFGEGNNTLQLDFVMGFNVNSIDATEDNHFLFEPTSKVHTILGYDWGIETSFWLANYLGVISGIHYQKYGLKSDQSDVQFAGDPASHTFSSKMELVYLSVPIQLKIGHVFKERHHVAIRFGPMASALIESKSEWTVDGQSFDLSKLNNTYNSGRYYPKISFDKYDLRFAVGGEYFFRMGSNGLGMSVLFQRGLRDLLKEGPAGDSYLQSMAAFIGYRRFF